jgi:ATP-binding cassette, subfamily B, bacterial
MKATISLKEFFFNILKPYRWLLLGFCLTGIYWAINNTLSPYVLKLIIDRALAFDGDKAALFAALTPYLAFYFLLWILIAQAMRITDWLRLKLYPSLRYDIVTHMFSYLNRHSHQYFQNNFAGSLANKIADMQSAAISICTTLDDSIAQCTGLVIAMIALLLVHPIFAFILVAWAAVFLFTAFYFLAPIYSLSTIFAVSKTHLMGKIVDSISNMSNVRLFSHHQFENKLIQEACLDTVTKDRSVQWTILKMRIWWDLSIIVLITVNIYMLIYMYSRNQVTIGDFSFIMTLSVSVFYNLWYLASQFVTFTEELGKCKQALSIVTAAHDIKDEINAQPLIVTKGRIEFDEVSFHYHEGECLFENKNVVIQPGEKVGLVGLSGSGKSTFVNLILRLFTVEAGRILIDGQNINAITLDSLREKIAMIPQDTSLFHRSLLENIRYGRLDASDEEVITASISAHCHEFISKLKDGYQSLVGERGIKLSGGQRQRIAIARALLKNAPILILDEATSSLDSLTEQLIQESLRLLMQGRTTIVIAHRLSTLSSMDRILVFDHGRIIEEGSHEELIKQQGHYARMWHMQAGGFMPDEF